MRAADNIFLKKIINDGLYLKISQAYAALLEGKAVGVVGDQRRSGYIIMLRAVCTIDFMTASCFEFSPRSVIFFDFLLCVKKF